MKTLIAEDDFTSRVILHEILRSYGVTHVAVNGKEAVAAVAGAMKAGEPYDLICLDVMMPEMDGQHALHEIRALEKSVGIELDEGVRIVMTTALGDGPNVMGAFREACDAYLVKPIDKAKLLEHLREWKLI